MFKSLVSVVIPCFNHADELPRAVRSALNQEYLHEIIIVDDGSSDASLNIAESLCGFDPRIAVFSTPNNMGPAGARNFGARYATGHFLAFLDADDEYTEIFLKVSVEALLSSMDMRAIKTWVSFIDDTGTPVLSGEDPRVEALVFSLSNNVVMTRESFQLLGGFPESAAFRTIHGGEDVAFNKALAKFLQPLGKLDAVGYLLHTQPGDHLDKFLKNTEVDGNDFKFISISPEQISGGPLEQAIESYLDFVQQRLKDYGDIGSV